MWVGTKLCMYIFTYVCMTLISGLPDWKVKKDVKVLPLLKGNLFFFFFWTSLSLSAWSFFVSCLFLFLCSFVVVSGCVYICRTIECQDAILSPREEGKCVGKGFYNCFDCFCFTFKHKQTQPKPGHHSFFNS